jgi:hypothetical protein
LHISHFARPKHLLFAFLLLKKHAGDEIYSDVMKHHKKTFNWIFIQEILDLHFEVAFACPVSFLENNGCNSPFVSSSPWICAEPGFER